MMRFLSLFVILLSLCGTVCGQSREVVNIYFNCDGGVVDRYDRGNVVALEQLEALMEREGVVVEAVYVESSTSPDGDSNYNITLSDRRLDSTLEVLRGEPFLMPDSLIFARSLGVGWSALRREVELSNVPYREEVIRVLEGESVEALRGLRGGVPYKYMMERIFPLLRRSCVTVVYRLPVVAPATLVRDVYAVVEEPIFKEVCEPRLLEIKPLFALKTNLLFDMLSLVNVEVEVPIRRRWSVAAELTFPWWTFDNHCEDSRRSRIQLFNGLAEGRYWWGEREQRPILTGWFTGLYAGGGLYDFERKTKGYQGEFFVAAGVSGGYAHTINRARTLRMEYSLGVGFLKTRYRYYEATFCDEEVWHAVEHRRGTYGWFGPTRAKVSLSFLLNYKGRAKRR